MRTSPIRLFGIGLISCMVVGQNSREDLKPFFTWERPHFVVDRLPIGNSATCRFKQSVITQILYSGSIREPQVQYASTKEDEADTVSFADLKTEIPKVASNGGQASLSVLYRNESEISLLNRQGLLPGFGQGTEIYTLFTDSGVILHATQHRLFTHPSGVTEMGFATELYC